MSSTTKPTPPKKTEVKTPTKPKVDKEIAQAVKEMLD